MTSIGSPSPFFLAGKKAYEVERSLRFNSGDSPELTRTPSGAGNRKTWTLSFWVKISNDDLGSHGFLFSTGADSSNKVQINLESSNRLTFEAKSGGSTQAYIRPSNNLRDISAWYHFVIRVDTTDSTSTNRIKIYINGTQQTDLALNTFPSEDAEFEWNKAQEHNIGKRTYSSNYFNGYLAEINFIDGQAYDSSYFGKTDPLTGQWIPKKYVGNYGTNGFYLNFSDNSSTSALGTDSSGNSNNFTVNNLSVSAGNGNDSSVDTPTNNFPTWNFLYTEDQTGGTTAYSEGNLKLNTTTASGNGNLYPFGFTSFGARSGKWYAEFVSDTGNHAVGIANNGQLDSDVTSNPYGAYANTSFIYTNSGEIRTNDGNLTNQASYGSGDIIGVAMDLDNMKLYFHKNGTYINSGNPSTGSNGYTIGSLPSGKTGDYIFSCGSNGASSVGVFANLGQIKTASTSYADAEGIGSFNYPVPTGFKALCTANLPDPTITLPNRHFDTLLYTGTGSTQSITGLNFQPDWVWLKSRSQSHNHGVIDSVRGRAAIMFPNSSSAEMTSTATQDLVSFDAPTSGNNGGITVGTVNNLSSSNDNGTTIVGWNWNAGDADSKTYKVKVVADSTDYGHGTGSNKYQFFKSDGTTGFGTNGVDLDLEEGGTYIFDWSDSSAQNHPIRFSLTNDGTHSSGTSAGTEYTTGVTKDDSAYKTTITIASGVANLFYYCQNHSGMGAEINTNTTKGSTNFDGGIQSVAKANTTSGFSIVTYTGNGSAGATVGHGLGVVPKIVIVKRRNSSDDWRINIGPILGSGKEGHSVKWNSTGGEADTNNLFNSTNPTSTVFTIGDSTDLNANTSTYLAYCFSDVASYSKFDKYVGNGSDNGTFVFTGFRPAWLLMKNVSSGSTNFILKTAKIQTHNEMLAALQSNRPDAEQSSLSTVDFLSNGFKIRNNGSFTNTNGDTYIYWCFAESPFKNARAR